MDKTARVAVRVSRAVVVFGLGRAVKLPLQYSHAVETLIRVPRALSLSGSPARAFCFESVARSTGASLSPRYLARRCRRYYHLLRLPMRPFTTSRFIAGYRCSFPAFAGTAAGLPSSGMYVSPRAIRSYAGGSAVAAHFLSLRRCQASSYPQRVATHAPSLTSFQGGSSIDAYAVHLRYGPRFCPSPRTGHDKRKLSLLFAVWDLVSLASTMIVGEWATRPNGQSVGSRTFHLLTHIPALLGARG